MEKHIYWVYFRENCDIDAIDEICFDFAEATPWYDDNEVRFYGTNERFQEFLRAIKTVEEVVKIR